MVFEGLKKFFQKTERNRNIKEKTIEDIELELKNAREDIKVLHGRYKEIKISGLSTGFVVQKRIFDIAQEIKELSEELEKRRTADN